MISNLDLCKVPECNKPRYKKVKSSLCAMHRTRLHRNKSLFLSSENRTQAESDAICPYVPRDIAQPNATGKNCLVTNCVTKVYKHGNVCAKHRWRMKKFDSYDLPGHVGGRNYLILPDKALPDGFVLKCSKSHGLLTLDEVYIRKDHIKKSGDGIQYHCKKCARDGNIRRNYKGMNSMECYQKMHDAQGGLCDICNNPQDKFSNNGETQKSLCIDHCHKTNKVRSLLCDKCNQALGGFRDSIKILESAIAYLKKHEHQS